MHGMPSTLADVIITGHRQSKEIMPYTSHMLTDCSFENEQSSTQKGIKTPFSS